MKLLLPIIAGVLSLQSATAQLLEEHFAYGNGNLGASGIGDSRWAGGDSASAALAVNSTAALTHSTLSGITGSGLIFSGGTFKKKAAPFTAQTSGTVYCSFLLNVQTAPSTVKAFVYFRLGNSATSSPELGVFLNGSNIGLGKKVSSPSVSTALSAGTHLIVARYSFLAGNDQVDLWVDPTSLGDNSQVPAATLTTGTGSTSDATQIDYIFLNHAAAQTLWLDELRVGAAWADVTPTSGGGSVSASGPVISQTQLTPDAFVLGGTNGPANGDYDVLTSTNAQMPRNQWFVIGTDSFNTNGQFVFSDGVAPALPQKFYALRVAGTNPPPVPPTITVQPHDTNALLGNTATFTVGASGTAPLTYRWYFNTNTPLTGANSSTLTLNNVQFTNAGGYSVVVTNVAGSVTSLVAQLIVTNIETPPFIITQPQNQTVSVGQTVNFSVVAGGSVPFVYQWYFNDTTPLSGQTNALLTLTNVSNADAGGYSAAITNAFGSVTSVAATLTVDTNTAPDFSAIGFCNEGRLITGGAGGPVVYVGSEAELQTWSDANSLPYIIYITNSFTLTGMATHIRPNKTVIGLGNVVLSGGGLYLYRSTNVIIRNLTISGSSEDNIGVHYSDHVWIDHCTLIDATDGQLDITQTSDYLTISWCKFLYTVNSGHDFVNLIASSDADNGSQYHTTFHHNWWSTLCIERMPSVRFGRVHCFNNYYNAPGNNYCVRTRIEAECRVENNFFENVKNPWEQYITGSGTQGKLFTANNNVPFLGAGFGVTWSGTTTNKDGTVRMMIPGTDAVFTPSYSYPLDSALQVPNLVTNWAGAGKITIP
jgi:pectate lyase